MAAALAPLFSSLGLLLVVLTSPLLIGCAYRIQSPPTLGEPLAITISSNQSRLVRAQGILQEEVGRALQNRLGWEVSPLASANLALHIEREDIKVAARSSDGSPSRYQMNLTITATLHAARFGDKPPSRRITAVGYAAGRGSEPEGLRQAANNAAATLANWLEQSGANWPASEIGDKTGDNDA